MTFYFDLIKKDYKKINISDNQINFNQFVKNNKTIKKNWSASVVDLDDGVVGVQLHSVLKPDFNPLDGSIVSTIDYAV